MPCDFCETPTGPIFVTDYGEDICQQCLDDKEQGEAEAAYERQCSAFYGGSGAQTDAERVRKAAAFKQALDR